MSTYRVPQGVLRAELKGEDVLLHPDRGVYHLINPTGRAVLACFAEGLDANQAAERIAAEADEPVDRVRVDVDAFVDALLERGLIEAAS